MNIIPAGTYPGHIVSTPNKRVSTTATINPKKQRMLDSDRRRQESDRRHRGEAHLGFFELRDGPDRRHGQHISVSG